MLLALTSNQKLELALVAGLFVVFALVSSMLIPHYRPNFPARSLRWFLVACGIMTALMLTTVVVLAKEQEPQTEAEEQARPTETTPTVVPPSATQTTPSQTSPTQTEPTPPPPSAAPAKGDAAAGKELFKTNCGSCHTLADAGTSGTVGPNLDDAKPSYDLVVERDTNGKGVMPPFKGTLSPQQIQDIATYISTTAGT